MVIDQITLDQITEQIEQLEPLEPLQDTTVALEVSKPIEVAHQGAVITEVVLLIGQQKALPLVHLKVLATEAVAREEVLVAVREVLPLVHLKVLATEAVAREEVLVAVREVLPLVHLKVLATEVVVVVVVVAREEVLVAEVEADDSIDKLFLKK